MDEMQKPASEQDATEARREFLKKCGKFAVVVPPTAALLLSGSSTSALATTVKTTTTR